MATAIHIEINTLLFLVLVRIVYHSAQSENQQMQRVLFRYTTYGIMSSLAMDNLWVLIDGKMFPGCILINQVVNALFLSSGIVIGCLWYLYVLETLGYRITHRVAAAVMSPGAVCVALDMVSIKTGWIFTVTEQNVYVRGPLFWVQAAASLGLLSVSLVHCLVWLLNGKKTAQRRVVLNLVGFYVIPFVGTLVSMPITGMPGTWTCAAVSIVLMYIDAQDSEIVRDTLTGLNNRKMLPAVFEDYARHTAAGAALYLYVMDLDDFKRINDTWGHPAGDEALITAAKLFAQAADGRRAMVARTGGDEFLIMAMMPGDGEASRFKASLQNRLERYTAEHALPYRLSASIGYCAYHGETLEDFIARADDDLYREKRLRKAGR